MKLQEIYRFGPENVNREKPRILHASLATLIAMILFWLYN